MQKIKYLHRKSRKPNREYYSSEHRRLYKGKNLNLLEDDLPKRSKINPYRYGSGLDFTPLYEFLESKVGENWDDVYSELLTKVKGKFRYMVDSYVNGDSPWFIERPWYDDDFLPRDKYGRVLDNWLFIDCNNIISKKSKEEIIVDAKKIIRKEKLLKIFQSDS